MTSQTATVASTGSAGTAVGQRQRRMWLLSGLSEGLPTLAGLRNHPIVNGQSLLDFCSHLATRRERELAVASSEWEAEKLVLQQLKVQRARVAGTSFDEEALSLLRFQRGLEAAARVAGLVDELISAPEKTGSR